MSLPPNVREYYEQLIQTATKGKVSIEWSLFTNRMKLVCKECDVSLTANQAESTTDVDYSVQEFIKLHSHTGGHCAHHWMPSEGYSTFLCSKCGKLMTPGYSVKPTAVTADFKKLMPGKTDKIDENAHKAEIIKAQVEKYSEEMKAKAETFETNAKLIQLQSKITELASVPVDVEAAAEMIMKLKEEQQALQNILILKDLAAKNAVMRGIITGQHAPPPLPRPKKVVFPTGRKFR